MLHDHVLAVTSWVQAPFQVWGVASSSCLCADQTSTHCGPHTPTTNSHDAGENDADEAHTHTHTHTVTDSLTGVGLVAQPRASHTCLPCHATLPPQPVCSRRLTQECTYTPDALAVSRLRKAVLPRPMSSIARRHGQTHHHHYSPHQVVATRGSWVPTPAHGWLPRGLAATTLLLELY